MGKGRERAKIKIIVPIISYPTCNSEFQKNRKKIIKKNIICYLNFIPDLMKIKIYSNKINVKHLKRIFLSLEVGKKKRMRR